MAGHRVLVITGDPIGKKMAGPAIRAWHIASALSAQHEVKLLSFSGVENIDSPFELCFIEAGDNATFANLEGWADVIVFQGHAMLVFERLQQSTKILVVDVYDPMHLEQLEQARELPRVDWSLHVADATRVLNQQLARGDFFICASERQRIFWLGQLAALGRINPAVYENDPDLRGLIDVVPFGLSETPPTHNRDVLKGVHPSIPRDAKVLLWSGGLYNWFDPHTLIRAVALLAQEHPEIRLFFQGTKHPHPGVPEMEIVRTSRELARELGVLDTHVIFNDTWVEFTDRQNYLLEADLGVSTHHNHIETMFAFRTRILDYLWANLPMVVTEGDHFGELVNKRELGIAVEDSDAVVLADAIEKTLYDHEFRQEVIRNIEAVRRDYFWAVVLQPLIKFVNDAHRASDIEHLSTFELQQRMAFGFSLAPKPSLIKRVLLIARTTGVGGLYRAISKKLRNV